MTTETSNTAIGPIGNNDPAPADDQATGADLQVPVTSANDPVTDAEVQLSNDSLENNGVFVLENDTTENLTIPQIDTSGIVMQSSDFSCGPAALATVLQNMGFNITEQELIVLAGTDTSGTTMHGLSEAAKAKGLSATGMKLSVDDLKPNNIVHIILDGEGHYSVIREVSENSVYLADPSLGNIEMSREEFAEIFTGNALVITDPNMQVNQTAEQANSSTENLTDTGSIQPENSQTLTAETMQTIRGRGGVNRVTRHWWGQRIYLCNITTNRISSGMSTAGGLIALLGVTKVVAGILIAVGGLLGMVNAGRGVRVWIAWTGHVIRIDAQ
jgi:predicted double-glycine peptidase